VDGTQKVLDMDIDVLSARLAQRRAEASATD
jgi:hypothetical protein